MPSVEKTPLPVHARLWQKVGAGDFIDGYATESQLSARAAMEAGLAMPNWAAGLLALRNRLVKPFGLKAETSNTGEGAIFPVEYEGADELIVGIDDSHLNFRICVMRHEGRIHMATWVHRNNLLGKLYLAAIMPFHVLIVRDAMRRIARG